MDNQLGVTVLVNQKDRVQFLQFLDEAAYAWLAFNGTDVRGKQDLFIAIADALPHSEDKSEIVKWAGLNDALWNVILDLESQRVVMIWGNCEQILQKGLDDFITACDLFICLARDLQQKAVEFTLALMGEGESFPPFSALTAR